MLFKKSERKKLNEVLTRLERAVDHDTWWYRMCARTRFERAGNRFDICQRCPLLPLIEFIETTKDNRKSTDTVCIVMSHEQK